MSLSYYLTYVGIFTFTCSVGHVPGKRHCKDVTRKSISNGETMHKLVLHMLL